MQTSFLVADKSRVDSIWSNFVVLYIDGNIPKRLTRGVIIIIIEDETTTT